MLALVCSSPRTVLGDDMSADLEEWRNGCSRWLSRGSQRLPRTMLLFLLFSGGSLKSSVNRALRAKAEVEAATRGDVLMRSGGYKIRAGDRPIERGQRGPARDGVASLF